ncbi:hemerythrin domain-containing protein [Candidatus Woesearchaeota archaeon]|nr:hemerythrin domain-containing protein [Candidatus Woesearchaeota archaeon]
MEELIKTLKEQHWELTVLCNSLDDFLKKKLTNDLSEWYTIRSGVLFSLKKLNTTLLIHLKLEDEHLYPTLLNSKDKKVKETAQKFSEEMAFISERVFSFFKKYCNLKVDEILINDEFRMELLLIITTIRKRMKIEDEVLNPLYEKIASKKNKLVFIIF